MASKSQKSEKVKSTETEVVTDDLTELSNKPLERQKMVAEAAYYLAEQRSFTPGQEMKDWFEAEKRIG